MQEVLKRQLSSYLSRYPKIFFCHVPKCAGVSLSNAIYSALYPKLLKGTRFASHIDLRSSRISEEILGIDMMTARESQLISHLHNDMMVYTNGHCVARPAVVSKYCDKWHFVTVLRDPVDRFISEYVYNRYKASDWQKNEDDIHTYLTSGRAKQAGMTYAKYFAGADMSDDVEHNADELVSKAVANLKQFAVCGTLDDMDGWANRFNQRFSATIRIANKNTSPNKGANAEIVSDEAVMSKIRQLCEIDQRIYDAVKSFT